MSQLDPGTFDAYDPQGGTPAKTSLLAVSGLVCSVVFCCPLTSLIGLLLGVGGLVSVSSSNGRRKGTGLAAAAIVIALISIVGQVLFIQRVAPHARPLMFYLVGPTLFESELERGDLATARWHLHPAFDAKITDEQLRDFAKQVADRYGTVQNWQPIGQMNFNPTPNGEETFDLTSQWIFSTGSRSTTMKLTVSYGSAGQIEHSGIVGIVIHDPDLGDLALDATTPGETEPPAPPKEPAGDGGG